MAVLDDLMDTFAGLFNPKGDMADWRHGSRIFAANNFRLAPKHPFLYHVYFEFSKPAKIQAMSFKERHESEAGLLVKGIDLPKFTGQVETKKTYNRTKHIYTGLTYDPITITFHDDNLGIINQLFEAYYRYYFVDGNYHTFAFNAYNKETGYYYPDGYPRPKSPSVDDKMGDITYQPRDIWNYRYGLDNENYDPFFLNIWVSQLARKKYNTYCLVNPIIENWNHGTLDSSATNSMECSMTVKYEAVHYYTGAVDAFNNFEPQGFGKYGYDTTPSPATILGGANVGLFALGTAFGEIADFVLDDGPGFGNNPSTNVLATAIGAANAISAISSMSPEAIQGSVIQEGLNIFTDATTGGGGGPLDSLGLGNGTDTLNSFFP